jgi:hypothetical protein
VPRRVRTGAASASVREQALRKEHLVVRKKILEREESTVRIRRGNQRNPASRQISGSCTGFKPQRAEEKSSDFRVIGVFIRLRIETLKVSKSREKILAVDLGRTRVKETGTIGV